MNSWALPLLGLALLYLWLLWAIDTTPPVDDDGGDR